MLKDQEFPDIPSCCNNDPSYLALYKIGSRYHVCKDCIKIPCWNRGIEEMVELD